MKYLSFFLSLVLTSTLLAPLHLDLEVSSSEYRELLSKVNKALNEDPAIERAVKLGERLARWISLVNESRSPENAIRLTSPDTRRGIPIEKPNKYSPSLINIETDKILSELPPSMKDVLTSSEDLPANLPVDDKTFILEARKIDRNYQLAARFRLVDSYRAWYISAAAKDVRGLYYLKKNEIGAEELKEVSSIPADKVGEIKEALTLLCINGSNNYRCRDFVEEAFAKNNVAELYQKHILKAEKIWDEFFQIPDYARRKDVNWSGPIATVPFNTPELPRFIPYLRDNIQDEFRWKEWALKLNFGTYSDGPYLKFEAGTVPHVNGLGGNEIVMDSNQPIEEYESQWTIRHEFGHVLGLPDCYHEFYDLKEKAYINYQLDIKDLMCSRAGDMNERIFLELKKAYE